MAQRPILPWKVLLSEHDKLACQAEESLEELTEALREPKPEWFPLASFPPGGAAGRGALEASLANGYSGIALFFGEVWRTRGRQQRDLETAIAYIERALEAVETVRMPPTLFDGFVGVAWAATCVWRQLELSVREGGEIFSLAEVDDAMVSLVARPTWRGSYDLTIGLVGSGLYLLDRLPAAQAREGLCTILWHLEQLATWTDQGATWFYAPETLNDDYRELFPNGYYNLGLAHGIPGVISFLSRLVCQRVELERANGLLAEALRWLLAQRRPPGDVAQFPEMLAENDVRLSDRLAWCYSDLSLAFTILDAGRNAEVAEWWAVGREIALTATLRHEKSAASMDSCVCHGLAGQAHLLNRLYQRLREPQLAEASLATFSKLLVDRTPGAGICGFPTWTASGQKGRNLWPNNAGLLNGVAGVGLALLSATSTVEPLWDRMLLLDEERCFE